MNRTESIFLNILKNAIRNTETDVRDELTLEEWKEIFRLASIHDVLPLVINSVYRSRSLEQYEPLKLHTIKRARQKTVYQAQRTGDFVLLYQRMNEAGLKPLVMKGIICRHLYETPELRPSSDEDMLIFPWQIEKYHQFMISNGYRLAEPETDIEKEDEISYIHEQNHLYLEVHKYLFPTDAKAYGDLNSLFSVLENRITEKVHGAEIRTFGHTDHLLYMICHAYKHVLYTGIGIRQICDIGLYTEKHQNEIDWERIITSTEIFRMDQFFAAILNICTKYLNIRLSDEACLTFQKHAAVDEAPLLEDILSGGLYGVADENRLHSSTMTLEVVTAQRQGKRSMGLVKTVFPSFSYMENKYTYLKKNKWLLPVAYVQRGSQYLKSRSKNQVNPSKTIEIGNSRILLLKKYNIID